MIIVKNKKAMKAAISASMGYIEVFFDF